MVSLRKSGRKGIVGPLLGHREMKYINGFRKSAAKEMLLSPKGDMDVPSNPGLSKQQHKLYQNVSKGFKTYQKVSKHISERSQIIIC